MRKWRQLIAGISVLLLLIACLSGITLANPPDDDDLPDPGPPPKGITLKIFIHPERGHAPPHQIMPAIVGSGEYAYAYDGIHWADPDGDGTGIPYWVNANFSAKKSPYLTTTAAQAAIVASFDAWVKNLEEPVSYYSALRYKKAGTTTATGPKYDGKNVIAWNNLRAGWIAVTYLWYDTNTKYLLQFDILLNNIYAWTYTPPALTDATYDPLDGLFGEPGNSGVANTYDVRDIMTHEAGHTLSLGDIYDDGDTGTHEELLTMYGYGYLASLKKDTLRNGDYSGLTNIGY